MNDKQQLAAMGAELRLTEEQAKALSERMPQTGTLQALDDEPLCMANRIEELEAQVRVMAGLLREAGDQLKFDGYHDLVGCIDAALSGNLPALHAPEGWQLVPGVPTRAMREAFHEAHEEWESGDDWRLYCPDHQWRAMLSAAPSPGDTK